MNIDITTNSGGNPQIGFLGAVSVPSQSGDVGTALVSFGLMSGTPTFASANLTGRAVNNVIYLRDEKSTGTAGGSVSAGSTVTRTLNTEVVDTGNNCSLSSNQFTLSAGTYRIRARGPTYITGRTRLSLYNATAATTLLLGGSSYTAASGDVGGEATLNGRFTVAASQALELRQYFQVASATFGLGVGTGDGNTEVYAEVWLEKEAS